MKLSRGQSNPSIYGIADVFHSEHSTTIWWQDSQHARQKNISVTQLHMGIAYKYIENYLILNKSKHNTVWAWN